MHESTISINQKFKTVSYCQPPASLLPPCIIQRATLSPQRTLTIIHSRKQLAIHILQDLTSDQDLHNDHIFISCFRKSISTGSCTHRSGACAMSLAR